MIKIPTTQFVLGQRVLCDMKDYEYPPFEATICGMRFDRETNEVQFSLVDDDGATTCYWPEKYISELPPVYNVKIDMEQLNLMLDDFRKELYKLK